MKRVKQGMRLYGWACGSATSVRKRSTASGVFALLAYTSFIWALMPRMISSWSVHYNEMVLPAARLDRQRQHPLSRLTEVRPEDSEPARYDDARLHCGYYG